MNKRAKKLGLIFFLTLSACSKKQSFKIGALPSEISVSQAEIKNMKTKIPAYGIVIEKNGRKELEVNIEAGDTQSLRIGQKAKAFIGSTTKPISAKVSHILRAVSSETGQSLAWLGPIQKSLITPGQFVTAWIYTSQEKKAVAIPKSAVLLRGGKKFVVIKSQDQYRAQEIKTGISSGKEIEVTTGVKAGDSILTRGGIFFLYPDFKAAED